MHSLTTPRRHNPNHEHAPQNSRRNILSPDDQFVEGDARIGVGGYYYGVECGIDEVGCPGERADYVVGWLGGGGVQVEGGIDGEGEIGVVFYVGIWDCMSSGVQGAGIENTCCRSVCGLLQNIFEE
jgi:hypothetical protein